MRPIDKLTIPAAAALGLLAAPIYADGLFGGDAESDRAAVMESDREGLRESGDTLRDRFEDSGKNFDGVGGDRFGERLGDSGDDSVVEDQDAELAGDDHDAGFGDEESGLADGDRSLVGLGQLDSEISASRDEEGVNGSFSSSGVLNGEPLEASGDFARSRTSDAGDGMAERSSSREVGGSLEYGDRSVGYDGSADRSSAIERTEEGVTAERSRTVDRELDVNGESYGNPRENSVSRTIESDRLGEGGNDSDVEDAELSMGDSEDSELDPSG